MTVTVTLRPTAIMSTSNFDTMRMVKKLDGDNFFTWKFSMELILNAKSLWDCVTGRVERPTNQDALKKFEKADSEAKAIIALSINEGHQALIRGCKTSKEILDAIGSHYERRNRQSRLYLRRKLNSIKFTEGGDVKEHLFKLTEARDKTCERWGQHR